MSLVLTPKRRAMAACPSSWSNTQPNSITIAAMASHGLLPLRAWLQPNQISSSNSVKCTRIGMPSARPTWIDHPLCLVCAAMQVLF